MAAKVIPDAINATSSLSLASLGIPRGSYLGIGNAMTAWTVIDCAGALMTGGLWGLAAAAKWAAVGYPPRHRRIDSLDPALARAQRPAALATDLQLPSRVASREGARGPKPVATRATIVVTTSTGRVPSASLQV